VALLEQRRLDMLSLWSTLTTRRWFEVLVQPAAGLELADRLTAEPALKTYHLLPSVRGDLLAKLGRHAEARGEFERAAALTHNARERALLLDRAAACRDESAASASS